MARHGGILGYLARWMRLHSLGSWEIYRDLVIYAQSHQCLTSNIHNHASAEATYADLSVSLYPLY
jgi:hypothetical protein